MLLACRVLGLGLGFFWVYFFLGLLRISTGKKLFLKKKYFLFCCILQKYAPHYEGPLLVGFGVWGLDFLGFKKILGFNLIF